MSFLLCILNRARVLETDVSFALVELQEVQMTLRDLFGRMGRGLTLGAAMLGLVGISAALRPAHAVDPGAAVGIGLGALAVGTALGAASNPYNPYYYPYGYYRPPAPAYTYSPLRVTIRRRRIISRGAVGTRIHNATTPARPTRSGGSARTATKTRVAVLAS